MFAGLSESGSSYVFQSTPDANWRLAAPIPASATSKALCPLFSSTAVFKSLLTNVNSPAPMTPSRSIIMTARAIVIPDSSLTNRRAVLILSVPQIYLGSKPLSGRGLGTWMNHNVQAYAYLGYIAFGGGRSNAVALEVSEV